MKLLWGAGAAALLSEGSAVRADAATVANCAITTPNVTEGPYWVEEQLFRSDIRTDPTTGVARRGLPLTLTLTVVNSATNCTALAGAYVDVWHCDAIGIYSDEASYNPGGGTGNVVTSGQKFLRGYQITDSNGQVTFTTIYPGWYSGRTIHIHVRVRTYDGATALTNYTTQVFFDDTITNTVLTQAPYNTRTSARDTTNANDMVYNVANNTLMLATLTASGTGYAAAMTVDLAAQTSTAVTPKIAPNAIVSAASGAVGAAPESWVSIFGTNLSPSTYMMAGSEVVNSYMPTKMQGVSVQIDGVAAYMYYVSAEQINVLVPADSKTGTVAVTVTSANGTSSAANATLETLLPGLFVQGRYVLAVRVFRQRDYQWDWDRGFWLHHSRGGEGGRCSRDLWDGLRANDANDCTWAYLHRRVSDHEHGSDDDRRRCSPSIVRRARGAWPLSDQYRGFLGRFSTAPDV